MSEITLRKATKNDTRRNKSTYSQLLLPGCEGYYTRQYFGRKEKLPIRAAGSWSGQPERDSKAIKQSASQVSFFSSRDKDKILVFADPDFWQKVSKRRENG